MFLVELKPKIKLWLNNDEFDGVFGDGKYSLLKAISDHGSITSAVKALNISYRKAWNDLKKAEDRLGKNLIAKSRGGAKGGSTSLTPEGQKLVEAYKAFRENVKKLVNKEYKKTMKNIINENF